MKYRKKPVVVEAITFKELVAHGLATTSASNVVNGMPWSFSYKGHAISHEHDRCYLIPTPEGTMHFTPDDMLITGVNGEIYPCKQEIFEKTYESAAGMAFGVAVEALKQGGKVARAGWNGKGMWLMFVPADLADKVAFQFAALNALPWIGMKTADDRFVPWLASQTDVLAEDWLLVE